MAAVSVCHGCVPDISLDGPEFATGTLKKQARHISDGFDGFPHGTRVIGADEGIVPGECRGVAGVINDRGN